MQIHTGFQRSLTVAGSDVDGNPVAIDTSQISVTTDNPDMVSVSVNPDGIVIVTDNPSTGVGSALVTVTVGALSATENVEIIAGDVATITLTPGDETPR